YECLGARRTLRSGYDGCELEYRWNQRSAAILPGGKAARRQGVGLHLPHVETAGVAPGLPETTFWRGQPRSQARPICPNRGGIPGEHLPWSRRDLPSDRGSSKTTSHPLPSRLSERGSGLRPPCRGTFPEGDRGTAATPSSRDTARL